MNQVKKKKLKEDGYVHGGKVVGKEIKKWMWYSQGKENET